MVASRRRSDADPPVLVLATTTAATNTTCKITEESMLLDLMLKAGRILTKNGWIDAEDSELLVLICAEAKEALRKEQEKKREASHHAQQLISAKDDRLTQQLGKEKAVLQAAYDQLLRRLNSQKQRKLEQNQPADSDANQQSADQSDRDKETKTLALKDADGVSDSPTLLGIPLDAFHSAMTFLEAGGIWTLSCCSKSARVRGHDEGLWRLIAKRDYPYLIEMVERIKGSNGGEDDEDKVADTSTWLAVARLMPLTSSTPGRYVSVPLPPPSRHLRLMYRRECVLDVIEKPELYRDSMDARPKPLSSYCLHLKFHLERDGRSVAVVSKFVDEMEFGLRGGESNGDAIRFTLDMYPKLREYDYGSIYISCDLVQRSTNKRCPLLPKGCLDYRFHHYGDYVSGEYWLETNGDNDVTIRGEYVETLLYIKTSQGKCPCTCGGWVNDPDV